VYDRIIEVVTLRMRDDTTVARNNLIFISGAGGTGKTYLYTAICQELVRIGKTFKCASWTGISSQLLPGGSTLHYTFGLPLSITRNSTSSLQMQSEKANVLRKASVIIIDEISMVHKEALRIIDQVLQRIMDNVLPFGGKLIVVGGDYQQLLPVVSNVTSGEAAMYSPCYSSLWTKFQIHTLRQNHRAQEDFEYATHLSTVGRGEHKSVAGYGDRAYRVRADLLVDKEQLVERVFGNNVLETCTNRSILTITNADAMKLNDAIIKSLPG
jgi:hypothetical protein